MKPFTSLTCLLLALISLLQLTRMLMGWDISIAGVHVPLWCSGVAGLVTGGLSALTWRESRR